MTQKTKSVIATIIVAALAFIPLASSYASGPFLNMMNLWDLFVEQMFGSFWAAVVFLVIIFAIILALGGISLYTNLIFNAYFVLAMAIGYGYPLLVLPLMAGSVIYFIYQAIKLFMENR